MSKREYRDTEFVHNTDLNPGGAYAASLPLVQTAIHFPALVKVFEQYNRIADSNQKVFRWIGNLSLWIGGMSLVGIAAELLLMALQTPMSNGKSGLLELCASIPIILALVLWIARTRNRWLAGRFMTEQIRQWHFQMFLDGSLMSKAHAARAEFEAERSRRWAQFMGAAPSAEGALHSLVDSEAVEFFHPITPYSDAATAEQALSAYVDLRFKRELAYFKLKREEFAERDDWSETVARWTIFLALLLTAVQLFLLRLEETESLRAVHASLLATALVLVVVSASVRVYRSALAVAQQRERYQTKWVRLVALKAAWDAAPTQEQKLEIAKEVERVEVEEMREFLRQVRRSSYLL